MKKITFVLNCMAARIKKKFFKEEKTDISHECEKVFEKLDEINSIEDLKLIEDYAKIYRTTTRWQTL